jgi:hypothetical protein
VTSEAKRSFCVTAGAILAFMASIAVRVAFADTFAPGAVMYHRVHLEGKVRIDRRPRVR